MDDPRPEKAAVVEEVCRRLDGCDAAILTEYRGLKVQDLAGLRRSLRPSGGEYKVFKNTLVRLAARRSGIEALEQLLVGPTGIAFVNGDAAAVAKVLREFSRANPLLVIKGGLLGEKVIGPAETAALADLPARDVLLAQVAGVLAAPMVQMARLLQALPQNLAYGLVALRDKLAEEGSPPEGAGPADSPTPPTPATSPEGATIAEEPTTVEAVTPTD